MGFWDSAKETFPTGVQLGARTTERDEERAENKRRWDIQDKREETRNEREGTRFKWEESDRQKKELYDKAEKGFKAAYALFEAGEINGDTGMQRQGAALLTNVYNQNWVNGDELKIVFKSDSANNATLSDKWNSDSNLKDKDVAILSKSGGIMPFKDLKDVFTFAAANFNMENFTQGIKLAKLKVAELNAKETPFKGQDGHDYVQTWKIGPGGIPQKGPVRAYTDVMKETEGQKKMREAETILGGKVSKSDRRVLAGLATPENAEERVKKAGLGRGEDALKTSKILAELTDKERNIFKKDMDMVLRPFAGKGEELFDEDGEMTPAANNALDNALQLIERADAGEKLAPEEKKKLTHARRAWDIYNKISEKVAAGYGGKGTEDPAGMKPEDAVAELKARGYTMKDGKWVKGSGTGAAETSGGQGWNPEPNKALAPPPSGPKASDESSVNPQSNESLMGLSREEFNRMARGIAIKNPALSPPEVAQMVRDSIEDERIRAEQRGARRAANMRGIRDGLQKVAPTVRGETPLTPPRRQEQIDYASY